jgi:hypothetical protein
MLHKQASEGLSSHSSVTRFKEELVEWSRVPESPVWDHLSNFALWPIGLLEVLANSQCNVRYRSCVLLQQHVEIDRGMRCFALGWQKVHNAG